MGLGLGPGFLGTCDQVLMTISTLKRQLEQKWRALDNFELSVKKLEAMRGQWRTRFATKQGELDAAVVRPVWDSSNPIVCMTETYAQARNTDLSRQLASLKSSSSSAQNGGADAAQLRAQTDRAATAERRAQNALNQLAALESKMADMQAKAGLAEGKWEARVREYENRLKIAGEKIKTEKQGGKERAMQLESQVRWVGFPSSVPRILSSFAPFPDRLASVCSRARLSTLFRAA